MTEGQFTRRQAQFISARHRHIKKHPYHAAPKALRQIFLGEIQNIGEWSPPVRDACVNHPNPL
ncbi:MAG: hypothetical protein IJT38_01660 [Clostridia bacterium]|nr:hypothetical protein [Clostridia bacterium]